jgi:cbb3-type cytochrome oxidase subunit 3
MRLSEIVSNSNVTTLFTEIGLVMFLTIFLGVLLYVFLVLKKDQIDYMGHLPLEAQDAPPVSVTENPRNTSSLDD